MSYKDPLLDSLSQVFEQNREDLNFKKYFALELYKKGEHRDAYPILLELFEHDKDLNIERALTEIESKLDLKPQFGFANTKNEAIEILAQLEKAKAGKITFADVAGMDVVKEAIRMDILYPLQHPELYKAYNRKSGGGILMYGPPGCGKTLMARATAGEINAEFFSVSIHEIISSWAGEGEKALHSLFEQARKAAPSVIFFDEIDAIGMSRGKTSTSLRTLVNQFLTELDGMSSQNDGLLIIGATNLPWEVDDALKRPGRFDRVIFIEPPDILARKRLFQIHLKDKPLDQIDYQRLSEITKSFSSADIAHICRSAAETAFKQALKAGGELKAIDQKMLEATIAEARSSIGDWLATVANYVTYSNQSGQYDAVKDFLAKNDPK